MSVVEAILVLAGILASSVISSCLGFSDGYKLGRRMGRIEGVVRDFECPKMEVHEDGDAK